MDPWSWEPQPGIACVASWLALFLLFAWVGERQRREAGGTRARWLGVVSAGATLCSLPALLWAVLTVVEGLPRAPWMAAALALAACGSSFALVLGRPVMPFAPGESLPLVGDEELLARIAELAESQGLSAPPVRRLHSVGGPLVAGAWAGGLAAPTLIVSDGVLHRFHAEERDAILAHELGHLSSRSLWPIALSGVIPALALVLVSTTLWLPAALAFGLALWTGLRRIHQRRIEIDCDLRGARSVGHVAMASALDKIHRAGPIGREGLLPRLVHALSTHPSRALRLAALAADAPQELRAQLAVDADRVRRLQRDWQLALLAWVAALASGAWLAMQSPGLAQLALLLWLGVSLAPVVLLLIAVRSQLSRQRARRGGAFGPGSLAGLVGLAIVFVGILLAASSLDHEGLPLWPALVALVLGLVFMGFGAWRGRGTAAARARVQRLFLQGDYEGIVAAGRDCGEALARDPALRHDVALARAFLGEREAALGELEEAARSAPKLPAIPISLALMRLSDDPEAALVHARRVSELLPKQPEGPLLEARALLALGRRDEVEEALLQADRRAPPDGELVALRARLAILDGRLDEAERLVDEALFLEPGAGMPLLARAELLLAQGSQEAAVAIEEALAAARANPFSFLESEVRTRSSP